jgi:hypothetical protein
MCREPFEKPASASHSYRRAAAAGIERGRHVAIPDMQIAFSERNLHVSLLVDQPIHPLIDLIWWSGSADGWDASVSIEPPKLILHANWNGIYHGMNTTGRIFDSKSVTEVRGRLVHKP